MAIDSVALYKQKLGLQDLLLGNGQQVQTRNGTQYVILEISAENLPYADANGKTIKQHMDSIQSTLEAIRDETEAFSVDVEAFALTSESYAIAPEDEYVKVYNYNPSTGLVEFTTTTSFSALHHSNKANSYAVIATTKASEASASAESASASESVCITQANIATTGAIEAGNSASNAEFYSHLAEDAEQAVLTIAGIVDGYKGEAQVAAASANSYLQSTITYSTNALNSKIEASNSAAESRDAALTASASATTATSAKDAVEAYVIPTEATYNPQLIDSKINALMPYSGYTQVSKKLDNFVLYTDSANTYKVTDTSEYVKFGDTVVDTYGPELVTNGDLYIHSNSDVTAIDGTVTVKNITTYKAWVSENYSTTIGKNYSINVGRVDGTFRIYVGNSNGSGDILIGGYGVYELIFKATSPTTYLTIENISSTTGVSFSYLDNISIREIQTADFSNDIPDVAEVITDGSNTTSVSVNAGDYVVDGSELIENNTFNTGSSLGGYIGSGATFTIVGERLEVTASGNYGHAYLNFTLVPFTTYFMKSTKNAGTANAYIDVYDNTEGAYLRSGFPDNSVEGEYDFTFTTGANSSVKIMFSCATAGTAYFDNVYLKRVSTTFRAIQTAPIGTALTNTAYFEDRTQIGVTNQVLSYHAYNTLTKAYEGIKTEVLFSDVSKEDLLNNDTWMSANGFSKVSKHLYSKGVYYVLPVGIWQSLNKGAYHPFLNGFGVGAIKQISNNNHIEWNESLGVEKLVSTAACFSSDSEYAANQGLGALINGGAWAARPDSKFYDIVYPDQFIDVRQYAKIATPYELELIRKDKEENGVYQYFNSLNSDTHLDIEFLGDLAYYPTVLSDIIASGITPKITFNIVDDNGVSNAFDGVKTSFKLLGKMTTNHQVLKSTDSGATWSVQTVTTSYITNTITFSVAPLATDVVIVSATANNDAYVETTPKPVVEVEPKVIATNSHSIYKGALVGNQVAGKIQVGNGANGYESKVLENLEISSDIVVTPNTVFSCNIGDTAMFTGFNNFIGVYERMTSNAVNSSYPDTEIPNTTYWKLVGYTDSVPAHSTIVLDSSTSSAAKYFNTLAEDTDNTYAQVFGEEITYDGVGLDWGDTDFSQLTNGTIPDVNGGSDVRTFCGLIPLNIGVK